MSRLQVLRNLKGKTRRRQGRGEGSRVEEEHRLSQPSSRWTQTPTISSAPIELEQNVHLARARTSMPTDYIPATLDPRLKRAHPGGGGRRGHAPPNPPAVVCRVCSRVPATTGWEA